MSSRAIQRAYSQVTIHHLQFGFDANNTLWVSAGGPQSGAAGWLNLKVFEATGDEVKSQGWTPFVLDTARSSFERHLGLRGPTQAKAERCDVRHLERLPLGMSYPAVVQHVKDLMARPPLGGHDAIAPATLVLDSTGVGNAVADIFDAGQVPHVRILITAGNETTGHGTWQRQQWHVPKTDLISIVDDWLHTGVLRFAAALSEAPAMRAELLDFRRSLSAAGRASYAARTGKHDDLVLAVAIGCWFLNRPPPPRAVWSAY